MQNRIADIRNQRKLTQGQLGEMVEAHWITISKLERGVIRLSLDWMKRLAEALDCQPHELIASPDDRLARIEAKLDAIMAHLGLPCQEPVAVEKRAYEPNPDPFIQWLKDNLARPGKSQSGLARHLGLDPAAINKVVSGKRAFKSNEIVGAADYFEAPLPSIKELSVPEPTNPMS